jgi:hypothetical protein
MGKVRETREQAGMIRGAGRVQAGMIKEAGRVQAGMDKGSRQGTSRHG